VITLTISTGNNVKGGVVADIYGRRRGMKMR
jgi:hypothetical protein